MFPIIKPFIAEEKERFEKKRIDVIIDQI